MSDGLAQLAGTMLPRQERLIMLAALVAVTAFAWLYLLLGASQMDMPAEAQARMGMMASSWTATRFLLTLLMWAVMMAAMMLPSATPAILTYAGVARRIAPEQKRMPSAILFAATYVLVWAVFSAGATLLQFGLDRAALLSPAMAFSSTVLGAGLLILAGLYQWAPLKDLCLRHCRIPLAFIAEHWRPGVRGALLLGIRHGLYCVGCCWALMLLLFVGGVMNLIWVAAISAFVLLEKLWGAGSRNGRLISGTILMVAGFALGVSSSFVP